MLKNFDFDAKLLAFLFERIFSSAPPANHPFFALPAPTLLLNLAKNMMEDEQKRRITCYHYYRYNNTQNKLLYSLKERKDKCVSVFLISFHFEFVKDRFRCFNDVIIE